MLLQIYGTGEKNKLTKEPSLYEADPKFFISMPDGELAPVYDYKNFPFQIFKNAPTCKKRGKTADRIEYYDLACSFDIESTTILSDDPYAFMYQWQYCIEDYVFMGKTWEDFMEFNSILSHELDLSIDFMDNTLSGRAIVTYIHNLSYEFQFMRYFIGDIISPLITEKYCPLLVPTSQGIVYRCSHRLTNKSLDAFTKGMPHHKLKGDLDYSITRVPVASDPMNGLTNIEMAYCYNDVKGLSEAIRDRLDKDKKYTIATIPLTSTGYVRKDAQISMRKAPRNRRHFLDTQLDAHLYQMCRAAFRGGNTHANAAHVGKVLHNVKSYDLASSYPAWILTQTYPLGKFEKIENISTEDFISNFNSFVKQFCCLVTIRLYNFEYIGSCGVPYISRSKTFLRICDKNSIVEDNGRIFSAPFAEMTLTDIDLLLVLKYYKYEKIEIVEAYRSHRGKLPNELRRVCYEYYKSKTELKGLEDPESKYNYARSKELLNACYGMMVQRIDRIEYEYQDNEYKPVIKPLQTMLDKFYGSESSFLSYQHGVWICAWARFVLQMGLDIAGPDMVYCDTDSVKFIGDHEAEFEKLNKHLRDNAIRSGAVAYNKEGKEYPVGIYDQEKTYTDFKTLGAKKYIYSYDNGKTIHSTISGVSKDIGQEFFTKYGFDAFKPDTIIPVSGKVSAHYHDEGIHHINIKGVDILTASSVALVPAAYTIHITHDYHDFIESIKNSLYDRYGKEGS